MTRYDAIVIGGGPAGLAASIAAARAGLSVLLTDARRPPVDKLCGEGLLPGGLAALRELGVALPAGTGAPFAGIAFQQGRVRFAADFAALPGLGLRRTALHTALAAAAGRAGVTMRWQTRAELEGPGRVRAGNEVLRCRYVIGADGQRSQVRQAAGLSGSFRQLRKRQRLAFGRHYACPPWGRFVEVYWSGRTQAYVTPVGPEEVGVAFITGDPALREADCLGLFPELHERLAGKETTAGPQGATSVELRLPRVAEGNVALIGEASGAVDAITGEGLSLLFRQALALGRALGEGDLRAYDREHPRILRRARVMSRLLLSLSEYPRWRSRVFQAFSAAPVIFEKLLALHTGDWPKRPSAVGLLSSEGMLVSRRNISFTQSRCRDRWRDCG